MVTQRQPNPVVQDKPSVKVACPNCGIVKLQSSERVECDDCEVEYVVMKASK